MHEVWKRKQVHEDARNMLRTKTLVGKFWKLEKASPWRSRFGKKNGPAGRSFDGVQKMLGLRTTEDGTTTDRKPEQVGTNECGKM